MIIGEWRMQSERGGLTPFCTFQFPITILPLSTSTPLPSIASALQEGSAHSPVAGVFHRAMRPSEPAAQMAKFGIGDAGSGFGRATERV